MNWHDRRRPLLPDPEPTKPTPPPSKVKRKAKRTPKRFVIERRSRPVGAGPDAWGEWSEAGIGERYRTPRAAEDALTRYRAKESAWVTRRRMPGVRCEPFATPSITHEVEYRVRDLLAKEEGREVQP